MMNLNQETSRSKHLHTVSQDYIKRMEEQHGIKLLNPSKPADYGLGVGIWGGKSNQLNKGFAISERGEQIFHMLKNKSFQTSDATSIFSDAHTRLYGAAPQSTMEQLQSFLDTEQGVITWFDMETLGSLDGEGSNLFTPTEVYFENHAFKKTAKDVASNSKFAFEEKASKGFLVKPNEKVEKNLRSLIDKIEAGTKTSLTEAENRTMADLLKYSSGAQIETSAKGTIVRAHSANYENLTTNKMINMKSQDTINKAREGLNTLVNSGSDSKTIATNMHNHVMEQITNPDGKTFVSGHNIKNFDFRALNKYFKQHDLSSVDVPNYIDTYQMNLALYPNPMAMAEMNNLNPEKMLANQKGKFTLDHMAHMYLDEEKTLGAARAHVAFNDTRANAEIFEKMFSNPQQIKHIENNVMRHGGSGLDQTGAFSFNMNRLNKGSEIYSLKGMSAWSNDSEGSFVTKMIDGKETLAEDSYLLPSHRKFTVEDYFEEDGVFGLKLYNSVDDQYHYINRGSKDELAKSVFSRFSSADNFTEQEMQKWDKYVRDDLARSKYRKLTSSTSSGGFMNLQKMFAALEEEEAIKAKGGNVQNFYNNRLPEIFSYEKNGKRVALGSYSTYYQDLKPRLQKDHAFMKDLLAEVDNQIPTDHLKGDGLWAARRQKSAAVVHAYQDYIKDAGGGTVLEKVPETKAFSLNILGGMGESRHISLLDQDTTTSQLKYAMHNLNPGGATNPAQQKQFLKSAVDRIEKQSTAFFSQGKNVYKSQELFKQGDKLGGRDHLVNFLKNTRGYLPSSLNADKKISILADSPGKTQEFADEVIKTLGLDRFDLDDASQLQSFKEELAQTKDYISSQDTSHYGSQRLAEVLHKNKNKVPGMVQPYQQILDIQGKNVRNKVDHNKYIKSGIEKAKSLVELGNESSLNMPAAHNIQKQLKMLDDNLIRTYKQFGFDQSKMPATMQQDLNKLMSNMVKAGSKKGLSFKMNMIGGLENPEMVMSVFDSGSHETMMGKTAQQLLDANNVTNIKVPLINMNREIRYGGVKKLSPLALIERFQTRGGTEFQDLSQPGGEIRLQTSFSRVIDRLNKGMGGIIDNAAGGNHREAQRLASKNVLGALNSLTGSNQYGEQIDFNATGGMADFFKKNSIVFGSAFEDDQGNFYNFLDESTIGKDGRLQPLYAGDKYNLLKNTNKLQQFVNRVVGENLTLSVAGTRGKQLGKGMLSASNVQDYFSMGYYNDPARDSMIQAFQPNQLTYKARLAFSRLKDVSMNPFMVSEGQSAMMGLDKAGSFSSKAFGPQLKVAVMNEEDMLSKLSKALETLEAQGKDVSRERAMMNNPESFPSLWENQGILSTNITDAYEASLSKPKTFGAETQTKLLPHVKEQIDKTGFYDLEYQKPYATQIKADGTKQEVYSQFKSKHSITSYKQKKGDLVLGMEEKFTAKEGVTKFMLGQEKFTLRNRISQMVLDEAYGEGVSAVVSPDFQGHKAYGDVLSGMFKDTVRQINKADIAYKEKQERVAQVSRMISDLTGMGTKVHTRGGEVYIEYSGTNRLAQLSQDTEVAQSISGNKSAFGLDKVVSRLNSVEGVSLQDDILTLQARFVKNEENVHYKALSGKHLLGKHGMNITPRQIDMLEANKYSETAQYLKQTVTDGFDKDIHSKLLGEMRAIEHLNDMAVTGKSSSMMGSKTFNTMESGEFVDKFYNKLGKGTYVDTGEQMKFLQGKFRPEDIKGSLVDPSRKEFILNLPDEVSVEVQREKGRAASQKIGVQNIFMAPSTKHTTAEGYQTIGDMERTQQRILQDVHDYNKITHAKDEWFGDDGLSQKLYNKELGLDDVKNRMQRNVQAYYDQSFKDLTSSKGSFMKGVASSRAAGSSGGKIQIMSPYLSGIQEGGSDHLGVVSKELKNQLSDNPNTLYIGEAKAKAMVEGLSKKESDALLNRMQGEGALGHATRFPTIHPGSTMPVKYKMSSSLNEDVVRMSSEMAEAMNADSDGDSLYYSIFHDPNSGFYDDKSFGYEGIEKDFQKASKQLKETNTKNAMSWRANVTQNYKESLNKDYGAGVIKALADPETGGNITDWVRASQQSVSYLNDQVVRQQMDLVASSKLKNEMFTGMVNNTVDQFRKLGVEQLMEDDAARGHFLEGMGVLIEEPISAKHISASGVDKVDPTQVVKALKTGQLSLIKQMEILSDDQYQAIEQAVGGLSQEKRYELSQTIGLSQQSYGHGIKPFLRDLHKNTASGNASEAFNQQITGNLGQEFKTHFNQQAIDKSTGQQSVDRAALSEKAAQLGKNVVQSTPIATPAGFSKFALGTAAGAGFALSELMGAGAPLPMDYMDDPALQPVPDGAGRTINAQVQNAEGMANLAGEDDHGRLHNISQIMQEENIRMTIRGRTTADKDPEELAQLASQQVMETMQYPVNMNVNMNDNRRNINSNWIEDQIVRSIRG